MHNVYMEIDLCASRSLSKNHVVTLQVIVIITKPTINY
jgi:hypothetical protein